MVKNPEKSPEETSISIIRSNRTIFWIKFVIRIFIVMVLHCSIFKVFALWIVLALLLRWYVGLLIRWMILAIFSWFLRMFLFFILFWKVKGVAIKVVLNDLIIQRLIFEYFIDRVRIRFHQWILIKLLHFQLPWI